MADLEDAVPVDFTPDLSDLAIVTVNVETRDGAQYTILWAAEAGRLSMIQDEVDGSDPGLEIHGFKIIKSV